MPSITATTLKQGFATAVLAALPLARAQGTTPPKLTAACNDVAIFMARGNDAVYHDARTSPFIDATCGKFKAQGNTCDYMDIVFDATYGVPFCPTIQEGAVNGVKQITEYNAKCPDTLIIINGYSQGAFVSGAALSGGGSDACNVDANTTGLVHSSAAGQAVKAALLWGDVKHTADQSYNVLDGSGDAAWPRTGANLARLNEYSDVLRSYCQSGDPVCAGGKNVTQHLDYFEIYTDEASTWVVNKLTPLLAKPSSSSSLLATPTPTPSAVSSTGIATTATPTSVIVSSSSSTVETTMISSSMATSVPYVTSQPANTTSTTCTDESSTSPVAMSTSSSTIYWANSTIPASSTLVTKPSPYWGNSTVPATSSSLVAVPYGTPSPYLPGVVASPSPAPAATETTTYPAAPATTETIVYPAGPATTKVPVYPVTPSACPVVYETVTETKYVYA